MLRFIPKFKIIMAAHKAGFVNIIGRPNVGKSTLMNRLVGERMSIITHKPQTTRHRIIGIVNDKEYQIVFSDTPGVIENPAYKMQKSMNSFVKGAFEDADVMIMVTDTQEGYSEKHPLFEAISELTIPKFLLINKSDMVGKAEIIKRIQWWNKQILFDEIFPISALKGRNTDQLVEYLVKYLPESKPFYPKDQLTDKSERFFVSEIIREQILELYQQEIPYSCEVIVDRFKEDSKIVRIHSTIYVNRKTQKSILIGKEGSAIKRLGTKARKKMEVFLQKKIFLDVNVKVKENWRDDDKWLKNFGYDQ